MYDIEGCVAERWERFMGTEKGRLPRDPGVVTAQVTQLGDAWVFPCIILAHDLFSQVNSGPK